VIKTVEKFLDSTFVKIALVILAVFGTCFGVWSHFTNQKNPLITMYEVPNRTVIVSTKEASDIRVYLNDKAITGDVVASQLVVWNAGNESTRHEGILDEVYIIPKASVSIYDVKILKTSRRLTDFNANYINSKNINSRRIKLDWKILEPDDAAIVQVIHSATQPDQQDIFNIYGTVEKQGPVKKYKNLVDKSIVKKLLFFPDKKPANFPKFAGYVYIIMGVIGSIFLLRLYAKKYGKLKIRHFVLTSIFLLISITMGVLLLSSSSPSIPLLEQDN
jgi:hypothetical protein